MLVNDLEFDAIDFVSMARDMAEGKEHRERMEAAARKLVRKSGPAIAAIRMLQHQAHMPDGEHKLVFAIVEQSIVDSCGSDGMNKKQGLAFLSSARCAWLVGLVGIDVEYFYRVLKQVGIIDALPTPLRNQMTTRVCKLDGSIVRPNGNAL